jgi:radical SAM superfamily enzyme YgiQ (UPF0313 family)
VKRIAQLVQVNHFYGKNGFLPYSAGMVQASAQEVPEISAAFEFLPIVYGRHDALGLARKLPRLDVLGLSCYIWNWEWSLAFARAVRSINRDCLIVMGGPQVPHKGVVPEADLLVHFEGEKVFPKVLLERLKPSPDYLSIPGVSMGGVEGPPAERIVDLDALPSPYLTGIFDGMMGGAFELHATQETHRGCPFDCSFCDWGSSVFTKVRRFSEKRIKDELEWCSKKRVELVYNADANFGMFKGDVKTASLMADLKKSSGYPMKFRAAYAKNSGETVREIAGILSDSGMNKGVTLSFQSMDDGVLETVKRKNIKVNDFRGTMAHYARKGIATYSEIILGLPGETYGSFADGLEKLIDAGQHDSINVYPCIMLKNSEMSDPAYVTLHGLKSVKSPMPMFHAVPASDLHQEYYDLVVETKTLPPDDWMKAQMFSWAVQTFHCMGLSSALAIVAKELGIGYRRFYEGVLSIKGRLIGAEILAAQEAYRNLREGRHWEQVLPEFGPISWSPEEASFLRLSRNAHAVIVEILRHMESTVVGREILKDAARYQQKVVRAPGQPHFCWGNHEYDIHGYVTAVRLGDIRDGVIVKTPVRYKVSMDPQYSKVDLEAFAREVVWYGRKGGSAGVKVEYQDV